MTGSACARPRRPLPAGPLLALGLLLALATAAVADPAEVIGARFARQLAEALGTSPMALDRLWAPGSRDSTRRELDLRTAHLFEWSDVTVELESARAGGRDGGGDDAAPEWVDVVLLVRGTATWNARAYGVAQSFWFLQTDESAESDRVVRREAWRLVPVGQRWLAHERVPLGTLEILGVDLVAGVYPDQDVLLVDAGYDVRAMADSVVACRFLLDRRGEIYRLTVDGEEAQVVRGDRLGSMGLEGFSSESESSFRFPRPLARGEEVHVRFSIRHPLVHMRGEGFVTTLPIHEGPFRERVWYPVPFPDYLPGTLRGDLLRSGSLEIRFPEGTLESVAPSADSPQTETVDGADGALLEEEVLRYRAPMHYRDFDFFLVERGFDVDRADWSAYDFSPFRLGGGLPFLPTLGGGDGDGAGTAAVPPLDPHPRSRRAIIEPLLTESTYSSRDLTSELQDLLPLDIDELDELFDDSGTDADQGAGEPTRD